MRAPVARPALDVDDLARPGDDFFAPVLERADVEREAFEAPLEARFAFARGLAALRAPVAREPAALRVPVARLDAGADDEEEEEPALLLPSKLHLPDMTRCAASATASAMIEPSLVALETTLLAACDAVSAASRPASRIFLRAAGLALIAAAAAARPAASISLLIAAFASLSTVLSPDPERDDDDVERVDAELEREELLRADFAIFLSPSRRGKTLYSRSGSRMKCGQYLYCRWKRLGAANHIWQIC
ncbi:MAG TPA: hypothetical protein VLM36_13510 [Sphingomicrobium sp.]|nr:hypothetical protein [Sphingomicrobium sp.]